MSNIDPAVTKGFSFWVAVSFTVNYTMGTGFLTLPWAFYQAGYGMAFLVMSVFAFFSVVSTMLVLETMSRAQMLKVEANKFALKRRKSDPKYSFRRLPDLATTPHPSYQMLDEVGGDYNDSNDGVRAAGSIADSVLDHDLSNPSTPPLSYQHSAEVVRSSGVDIGLELDVLNRDDPNSDQFTPVKIVIDKVMNTPKALEEHLQMQDHISDKTDFDKTDLKDYSQFSSIIGDNGQMDERDMRFPDEDSIEEFKSIMASGSRLEITDLCELFLGLESRNIYSTILGIYMYGTLTAYLTIFVTSLASNVIIFEDNQDNQILFSVVFFFCTVPVSCLELDEQIEWQVALAVCRGALVVIMIISCLITRQDGSDRDGFYFANYPNAPYGAPMSDLSGIITLLPLAGYANIFQHSIPALGFPVENKKEIAGIFITAIMVLLIAYSSMGSILSSFFGGNIPSSSNLAWLEFYGQGGMYMIISRLISYFIVLFPALDVASAYPLNAITLGNSMITTFKNNNIYLPFMSRKLRKKELRILFRVLASSPPFFVTIFCSNFESIVSFSGLVGFLIAMVIPALLAHASKKRLERKKMDPDTPYTSVLTSNVLVYTTIIVGIVMTVLVTITTVW